MLQVVLDSCFPPLVQEITLKAKFILISDTLRCWAWWLQAFGPFPKPWILVSEDSDVTRSPLSVLSFQTPPVAVGIPGWGWRTGEPTSPRPETPPTRDPSPSWCTPPPRWRCGTLLPRCHRTTAGHQLQWPGIHECSPATDWNPPPTLISLKLWLSLVWYAGRWKEMKFTMKVISEILCLVMGMWLKMKIKHKDVQ